MKIKAVLFDKDGTLIDVNGTWIPFYKAMLVKEQGLTQQEAVQKMVVAGYDPSADQFRAGSALAGGTTRQLVALWWPNCSDAEQDQIARRVDLNYAPLALEHLKPLLPLQPILQALRSQLFLLGIGTNDSEYSARNHMRALGVDDVFHTILGADSVPKPKPSGDMVRRFAERTGFSVGEIAMVGDNIHDIEEGRNGGAGLAIAVLTGNAQRHHLQAEADIVLDSVADLPAFLART